MDCAYRIDERNEQVTTEAERVEIAQRLYKRYQFHPYVLNMQPSSRLEFWQRFQRQNQEVDVTQEIQEATTAVLTLRSERDRLAIEQEIAASKEHTLDDQERDYRRPYYSRSSRYYRDRRHRGTYEKGDKHNKQNSQEEKPVKSSFHISGYKPYGDFFDSSKKN